jgi:hypothetical protein
MHLSSNKVDCVKMVGKCETTGIDVDGHGKGMDVWGLFVAPPDPVLLMVQDGDILPAL